MTEDRPRRVLLTGGAGYLGQALLRSVPAGWEVHATWRNTPLDWPTRHRMELADAGAVEAVVDDVRPDLILHTAAAMENFERDIVRATEHVAAAAASAGAQLLHMSTDALFDGEHAPYSEADMPAPVHAYGRAKARAEWCVRTTLPDAVVVRTSLITGLDPLDARSAWIVENARSGEAVTPFVDEIRCPIAVADLAAQLWEIAALPREMAAGVWHLAGPEALTRYALALLLAARFDLDRTLLIVRPSSSHPTPRPRDVRLLTTRADRNLTRRARPISEVILASPSAG